MFPELLAASGSGGAVTYGASGTLRRQIEAGAPIDAALLASAASIDALVEGGFVDPASRRVVASNRLVLVAPRGSPPLRFEQLDQLPSGAKLAIGEPGAVPAGAYAREALTALGSWGRLGDRLVFGRDVTAVLTYARRGEVRAAIVYATDLAGHEDVSLLDEATGDWAPAPRVVFGRVGDAPGSIPARAEAADAFGSFLSSPAARAIFSRHGFGAP